MSEQEIKRPKFTKQELEAETMAWARFLYKVYKRKKKDGSLKISQNEIK